MINNPYTSKKRSISVDKKSTTISMESVYWDVLEKLAKRQRMSWRDFAR